MSAALPRLFADPEDQKLEKVGVLTRGLALEVLGFLRPTFPPSILPLSLGEVGLQWRACEIDLKLRLRSHGYVSAAIEDAQQELLPFVGAGHVMDWRVTPSSGPIEQARMALRVLEQRKEQG